MPFDNTGKCLRYDIPMDMIFEITNKIVTFSRQDCWIHKSTILQSYQESCIINIR